MQTALCELRWRHGLSIGLSNPATLWQSWAGLKWPQVLDPFPQLEITPPQQGRCEALLFLVPPELAVRTNWQLQCTAAYSLDLRKSAGGTGTTRSRQQILGRTSRDCKIGRAGARYSRIRGRSVGQVRTLATWFGAVQRNPDGVFTVEIPTWRQRSTLLLNTECKLACVRAPTELKSANKA